MKNFNRIVFYGCSFTVGSELSDRELYPELSVEEIRRLKVKKGYEFYHKFDDVARNKLDNPKAWPRWFCDELDIAWDNRAVGGSSTGAMIFNIERDLSNGSIKDTDLIIVGITSPERICTFDKFGSRSYILNDLDTSWDKNFKKEFSLTIADDNYILFNWYKDIKYLDLLSSRLNGRLFQQYVWATIEENSRFAHYNLADYMQTIITPSLKFDSIIDDNFSFSTLNTWAPENSELFHHPKIELQQEFGRRLAKKFIEKIKESDL